MFDLCTRLVKEFTDPIEIEEQIEMFEEIERSKCFLELFFHHFFKILLCSDQIIYK